MYNARPTIPADCTMRLDQWCRLDLFQLIFIFIFVFYLMTCLQSLQFRQRGHFCPFLPSWCPGASLSGFLAYITLCFLPQMASNSAAPVAGNARPIFIASSWSATASAFVFYFLFVFLFDSCLFIFEIMILFSLYSFLFFIIFVFDSYLF